MSGNGAAVLAAFPKSRTPLPEAYQAIYAKHYAENRSGGSGAASIAQRLESWMHRQVASDAVGGAGATLEIGAGNLNHLPYETDTRPYDVVEPFEDLFRDSVWKARVRHIYRDLSEVEERGYQRIVSIAAFEHICELPDVVARSGLLLADGGSLRAAIPSEGRWLWKLAWTCSTGLEFRIRHGLDYGTLMRFEHVNEAREIEAVLRWFFSDVSLRVFGVTRGVSLYQAFVCRAPRLDRCAEQLAG